MSHSKVNKKGRSYLLNERYPFAYKYVVGCRTCGAQGYSEEILKPDFGGASINNAVAKKILLDGLNCLKLNEDGICNDCSNRYKKIAIKSH